MTSRRFLPLLLLLFVGSGCAALIYEIVWFQLLELVIGSSAISLAVLLGTFMGGMCLGSLALPRMISTRQHPLRVYACLELGIGAIGVLVLFGMPLIGGLYTAWSGSGIAGKGGAGAGGSGAAGHGGSGGGGGAGSGGKGGSGVAGHGGAGAGGGGGDRHLPGY